MSESNIMCVNWSGPTNGVKMLSGDSKEGGVLGIAREGGRLAKALFGSG